MSETSRRGPYAKGVARREQILQAALQAYAESDSSGPSLRSIAGRVGLSERGLLHYFASKDELFVEILAQRDASDVALLDLDAPLDEAALMRTTASQTQGLVRLFLQMAVAAPDPTSPAHPFFIKRYARLRDYIRHMFTHSVRQLRNDAVDEADADFAARILVAASDGLQLQWLLDPGIDMQSDLQRLARALEATPRSPEASGGGAS
jgi:AcrR family transcriptional regulator